MQGSINRENSPSLVGWKSAPITHQVPVFNDERVHEETLGLQESRVESPAE